MNANFYLSVISTVLLSLPILFILVMRLYENKSFQSLGFYYLLALLYNLISLKVIPLTQTWKGYAAITNNLFDVPLLLIFTMYFTRSWRMVKQLKTIILAYVVFELITIAVTGFSINTSTVILGPGIVIIAAFALYFFINHIHVHHDHPQEPGKIAMLAGLLFCYGCYLLIYLFHYVLKLPYMDDILLVYYIVTSLTSITMCAGIWAERNKILQSEADVITSIPVKAAVIKNQPPVSEENEFRYM
jgi:hypothetical protein